MRLRTFVVVLLAAFAALSAPAAVYADSVDPGQTSVVQPGSNAVIVDTPRSITVRFDDPAAAQDGLGSVKLFRAKSGKEIPSAGAAKVTANTVEFPPPSLEAGTYVIEWTSGSGLTRTQHRSVFSVGNPDTSVTGAASTLSSPLSWPARGAGVLLALVGGVMLARRKYIAGATTAVLSWIAFSLAVLPSGWWTTLLAAPGLMALGLVSGAAAAKGSAKMLLALTGISFTGSFLVAGAGLLSGGGSAFGSLGWVAAVVVTVGTAALAVALAAVAFAAARRGAAPARSLATVVTVISLFAGLTAVVADPSGGSVLGGRALQLSADARGCLSSGNVLDQRHCLEQLYTLKVESAGVKSALEDLSGQARAIPQVRSFCHETSHAIGRAALRTLGSVKVAFETGFDVCDFGYYHGIIEGAGGDRDDTAFRKLVPTLCADLATSSLIFFEQCAHGLGHAAARRANNDMVKALSFCEELDGAKLLDDSRRGQALLGCGTGVTMEWFAVRGLPTASPEDYLPVVDNPREACVEVPERWMESCYEYIGNLASSADPVGSLTELAGWCETSGMAAPCFKGIARAAAGMRLSDDLSISLCALAPDKKSLNECASMLLYTYGATVEFRVDTVDRLCAKFPTAWNTAEMCRSVRAVVDDSLNGVRDGKGAETIGIEPMAPTQS